MKDDGKVLFPKYLTTDNFDFSSTKATSTVIINNEDGKTIFYLKGIVPTDETHTYTSDNVLTINKSGNVEVIKVSSLPLGKTAKALGNKTDILFISNQVFMNSIIFFTNPHEPNTIRAKYIKNKQDQLNLLVQVEETNFHVFPYTDNTIMFTPNKNIFNRVKEGHIKINNPKLLFKDKDFVIIDINKLNKKDNVQLIRYE